MPQNPALPLLLNSLASKVQEQNQPVEPIFSPPKTDPYSALETILNNLNNQPIAQAPPMSTLDRILIGIGNAASVAASANPGETLAEQIKANRVERIANTEALRQRQNFISQVKVQAGLQQASNLAEEQARIREENRKNFRQIQAEKRETASKIAQEKRALSNYKEQKMTDLDISKQEFEQNEELLTRYAPLREARMRHELLLKQLPDQMVRSAEWQSIAELTDAGMQISRNDLKTIGDKLSGIDKSPLSLLERQVLNNINTERKDKLDRKFQAEVAKTEAETSYILQGKPGSLTNVFEKGVLNKLGQGLVDTLDNVYYKLKDGNIVTLEQLRGLGIIQQSGAKPLTDEENKRENQKRIEQIKQLVGKGKDVGQAITTFGADEIERGKRVLSYALSKGYTTREQHIAFLKANNFTDEVISIVLGLPVQSGMTPAKPQENKPSGKEFDRKEFLKKNKEISKEREQVKGAVKYIQSLKK